VAWISLIITELFTDKTLTERAGQFQIIPDATKVLLRVDTDTSRFRFGLTNGESTLELAVCSDQERSDWLLMITRVGFREFGKNHHDEDPSESNLAAPPNTPVKSHYSQTKIIGSPLFGNCSDDDEDGVDDADALMMAESGNGNRVIDVKFDSCIGDESGALEGRKATGGTHGVGEHSQDNKSLFLLFPGVENSAVAAGKEQHRDDDEGHPVAERTNNDDNLDEEEEQALSFLDIRGEVKGLFFKLNQGHTYDHDRLSHLLQCLDSTPVFREKEHLARDKWFADTAMFAQECFEAQRGYVPPTIFCSSFSFSSLPASLARRLCRKKSLWLLRMSPADISRLSLEELSGVCVLYTACVNVAIMQLVINLESMQCVGVCF
jgi:hypothetical protein